MKQMKYVFILFAYMCISSVAFAQASPFYSTQNQYVKVTVNSTSGQFYITSSDAQGNYELTSAGSGGIYNSYTTFYLHNTSDNSDKYYCNQSTKVEFPTQSAPLAQYVHPDSTFPIGDTIRSIWGTVVNDNFNFGFTVVQNVWPILTPQGGQIMIQYVVTNTDVNSSYIFNGVMLLMDMTVNANIPYDQCQTAKSNPLILTANQYDAAPSYANRNTVCWNGVEDRYTNAISSGVSQMPGWYVVGFRFPDISGETDTARQPLMAKGTLRGAGLVEPNELIVADYGTMVDSTWDFSAFGTINPQTGSVPNYAQPGIGYKWNLSVLGGSNATVATAYGMNDYTSSYAMCQGPLMTFVGLSERDHYRQNANYSVYDSLNTWVDVYVANVDHAAHVSYNTGMKLDLTGAPDLVPPKNLFQPAPLTDNPGQSTTQTGFVAHTYWNLMLDTVHHKQNTTYTETLSFRDSNSQNNAFYLDTTCPNLVTITYHPFVNVDTVPPTVQSISTTRLSSQWEVKDNLTTNIGIDTIEVVADSNYSYTVGTYTKCQASNNVSITATVKDTTKHGRFVFKVIDCNSVTVAMDSATFTPGTISVFENSMPSQTIVSNYPNPFSATTQLYLPTTLAGLSGEKPAVRVFSVLGEDVTRTAIQSDVFTGGSRIVTINGALLPAGLYTAILQTTNGIVQNRMMLIK